MATFLETLADGTIIVYLLKDFTPATKETAEMVKVLYPDGRVVFGYPLK